MKIALVHDQLQEFGGAERVLVSLKKIFPDAHVYTSFYNPKQLGHHGEVMKNWDITTSWFNKIPFLKKLYSPLRFITPKIWESFDFPPPPGGYDLVISSSGSYMCKGIITKPGTTHICYLHHPPRYLYNYETAIEWQKYLIVRIYGNFINHFLRMWDFTSSQRPQYFIANSEETKRRIKKFYRRDAVVIYPPVNISNEKIDYSAKNKDYYLTVSRLARAKHVDILIKAANIHKFKLKIVGTGRDEKYLKSIAGSTVEFIGNIKDAQLSDIYKNAKAFLFSSVDEEFGIAPVEAMSHGLPVIAFNSGGLPETVKENVNGFLFDKLTPESLTEKIKLLESLSGEKYIEMKKQSRIISEQFSEEKFKENILNFVKEKLNSKT